MYDKVWNLALKLIMIFSRQSKAQKFLIKRNIIEWISETMETNPPLTNIMDLSLSTETLNESISDDQIFHEKYSVFLLDILSAVLKNPLAENHVNKICSSLLGSIKIYLNSRNTIDDALIALILLFKNPFVRSKAKVRLL